MGAWSGAREGRGACQLQDTPLSVPSPDLKANCQLYYGLFSGGICEEFDVG
ncbi:MAG: hypothetical protein ACK559_02905 [bacterium]